MIVAVIVPLIVAVLVAVIVAVTAAVIVAVIVPAVDAVMVAHLNASDFQFNYDIPATLSKFWVTDILKDSLNFEGVIVTDAMSMGAITKMYSNFYGLVSAIKAGCDYIIISGDYKESIDIIEKLVLDGTVPISRINESALKILRRKKRNQHHTMIPSCNNWYP